MGKDVVIFRMWALDDSLDVSVEFKCIDSFDMVNGRIDKELLLKQHDDIL